MTETHALTLSRQLPVGASALFRALTTGWGEWFGEPDTARITAWFTQVAPLIRVAYDIYNPATDRWSARALTVLATTALDGSLLPTTPDALLARLPAR